MSSSFNHKREITTVTIAVGNFKTYNANVQNTTQIKLLIFIVQEVLSH